MIEIDFTKTLDGGAGSFDLELKLALEAGQFTTIYGASGAGKTSTLRMISGLMTPDRGSLVVNNEVWYDSSKKINKKPQERSIGFVFQDYALFGHMTVLENLIFAKGKNDGTNSIDELLEVMELQQLEHRKPETLSGGQKQRVALARALVQKPKLLLLDEPFAALDNTIRFKLHEYLKRVQERYDLTTILISHEVGEIIKLADKVVCLEQGRINKIGSPDTVFTNQNLSGKFKFPGVVVKVEREEIISVVSVRIHTQVVKVVVQHHEAQALALGDQVIVVSKAFNPILYKLEA
ncbi:ATP-binding cassette domain-containing protein [Leeuwenhoekiella palythoae]|uniref:Molybdate transport system ATP-binding protein n=1 Tax=Leeuwenhoekiella palythoae TaxID=573501 RepID=A0A1M5Z6R7_9FLAO|nr:ATP-binding cassette domain-containing protein [Leeuwenhoekiella palythoae]RXG28246.1 molybdate transport system ATP-binding protein [Leeuwenhoekiella palythoae]SHI19946.1 molybdate transport system ATP-binding protein [Leeuwenhoekiella palythoae]